MRLRRVLPGISERAPPAQKVPALIEFDLNVFQAVQPSTVYPGGVCVGQTSLGIESVLFIDKILDMFQHRLVLHWVFHFIPRAVFSQNAHTSRGQYHPLCVVQGCAMTKF
jgi:hypothetical protein